MPLVGAAIVVVMGGATLYLEDERFIKLKPTLLYGLFALVLLGGQLAGRPLLKPLFGSALALSDAGWRALSWRWVAFFTAMAALNEVLRRVLTTDQWVTFKVFGALGLTFAFPLRAGPADPAPHDRQARAGAVSGIDPVAPLDPAALGQALVHTFRYHKELAERALAQVDDARFLEPLEGEIDPLAVKVKHVGGNLCSRGWRDFLESDGEKPDRRRDGEFELGPGKGRSAIMDLWERGWSELFGALESLRPADWSRRVAIRGELHTVPQAALRKPERTRATTSARSLRSSRAAPLSAPPWKKRLEHPARLLRGLPRPPRRPPELPRRQRDRILPARLEPASSRGAALPRVEPPEHLGEALGHAREAARLRVELVGPPVLVLGAARQRAAQVEMAHVCKRRLPRDTLEHHVEAVDQCHADLIAHGHVAVALLPKAGLQPRTGQRSPIHPRSPDHRPPG